MATVLLTCLGWTLVSHSGFVPQLVGRPPALVESGRILSQDDLLDAGAAIYEAECTQCHLLGMAGRGPDLAGIGLRAADRTRELGLDGGEGSYLLGSLCRPADWLVPGFAAIMPPAQNRLEGGQILALAAFLQSLGAEPTIDGSESELLERHCSATAAGSAPAGSPGSPEQVIVAFGCLACHDMAGEARGLGPGLGSVGARLSREEIRLSLLDPDASIPQADPPWVPGLMKATLEGNGFYRRMGAADVDALVEHLAALGKD